MYFFKYQLRFGFIGLAFFILTHGLYGQSNFKNPAIAHDWSHTAIAGVSENGEWIHYNNYYAEGRSEDFVQNIKTNIVFENPNMTWGEFSVNNKYFAMHSASNSFMLRYLDEEVSDTIPNVKSSLFSNSGDYLITQSIEDSLLLTSPALRKSYKLGKSEIYEVNPQKDILAMAIKNSHGEILQVLDLEKMNSFDVYGGENISFQRFSWSANGENLAFLYSNDNGKTSNLGVFNIKTRTSKFLDLETFLTKDVYLANSKLSISDKGEKVFFSVRHTENDVQDSSGPEVWDTFDRVLYPRKIFYNSGANGLYTNLWYTKENRMVSLGSKEFPQVLFNRNSNYVLCFDAVAREPQFRSSPFVDIYAMDVRTGRKDLVVANQFTGANFVSFSPQANFVTYFRDKHWWVYDIKQRKHSNLSIDLPYPVYDKNDKSLNSNGTYGLLGWSEDDKELFIYDEYDIWKFSSDGVHQERLTEGRPSNTIYRVADVVNDKRTTYYEYGFNTYLIGPQDGLLLRAENRKLNQEGFYKWDEVNGIRQIVSKNKRLKNLVKLDSKRFLYTEQSFLEPISIEYVNLQTNSSKTIYISNPEWDHYKWPQRKLIEYNTQIADSLKGVLIYPLDYDSKKKYPMIVNIYAEQSARYNLFEPPSLYDGAGFNYMNYALDGYFVLLPDIKYNKNAPGISATICVEKAVQTVLKAEGSVDEKRLGLIGHSLGGYETAFIISQTDIFATAVAGSGILNLVSFYFDIYKTGGQSEITRVEENIFKMQHSFFQNPEAYFANSPLHQASHINTPILLWTGKEDANVNPNQSLQGYLALRRLRKPGRLLYYADEAHMLQKKENKMDLSIKIKEWFDSYLK